MSSCYGLYHFPGEIVITYGREELRNQNQN